MGYGPNIREARKKAGLTQEQLAKKCGLATITIRQYELEKRTPPLKTIEKIAEILSVSPLDLAGNGDEISIDWIDISGEVNIPVPDYPLALPSDEQLERMAPADQEYYHLRLLADTAPDTLKKLFIDSYDRLNKLGQVEAVRRTKELSERSQYTEPDPNNRPIRITVMHTETATNNKD